MSNHSAATLFLLGLCFKASVCNADTTAPVYCCFVTDPSFRSKEYSVKLPVQLALGTWSSTSDYKVTQFKDIFQKPGFLMDAYVFVVPRRIRRFWLDTCARHVNVSYQNSISTQVRVGGWLQTYPMVYFNKYNLLKRVKHKASRSKSSGCSGIPLKAITQTNL
jgi:hypothetical protein